MLSKIEPVLNRTQKHSAEHLRFPEVQLTDEQTGFIAPYYLTRISRTRPELENTAGYRLLLQDLTIMADICKKNGSRFAVMFMPDKAHVYLDSILKSHTEETWASALGWAPDERIRNGMDSRRYIAESIDSFHDLLQNWASIHDAEFIDLLPPFRESAGQGTILYGKYDTHLNPKGHERLAEILSERIPSILKTDHSSQSNPTESHSPSIPERSPVNIAP